MSEQPQSPRQERGEASAQPAWVELPPAMRDELLDPEIWHESLEAYAHTTNLAVVLVDATGRLIGECINPQPTWSLLHAHQAAAGGGCPFALAPRKPCTCVGDALAKGGLVLARDRTGLVHFTVPLVLGDYPVGALLAGQAFDRYPEQLLLEHVAKHFGLAPHVVWQGTRLEPPVKQATLHVYGRLLATLGNTFLQTRYHTLMERQSEEKLRQTQKLEAIGRLAGGVAHDYNNLMTVVLGFSELLLSSLDPTHPMRSALEAIQKAATSAAGLTRQLLAFGRKQVLQPVLLDLNTLVSDAQGMLQRLIGEDVILRTSFGAHSAQVMVDRVQMEQVLLNLAANARDAMPWGGTLSIETADVVLDDAFVRQHAEAHPGLHVVLAVTDTGVGMDAETLSHVFEPFFTTRTSGEGTGLGLSTVYGIVTQSGGFITVYSEPGRGTTFKSYLPTTTAQTPALAPPRPPERLSSGHETILVVEDDPSVRELVCTILGSCGYTLLDAASSEEALQRFASRPEPIHLVLTDVVMPGMSGAEMVQRLTAARGRCKVLFMSGYAEAAVKQHGVLAQGTGFLEKPFTPSALAERVRWLLDASA